MSKSRNEKKPPGQQVPVVATANDIIPGKFNEHQWSCMVEQENSQEFILELVDNIVNCSLKVIYDKYIESQLNPYSVQAAKNLLLQIIESRFLAHDKGDDSNNYWCEDDEPVPCVTDSWSQGSVPVKRCPSRPLSARSEARCGDHFIIEESESFQLDHGEDECEQSSSSSQVDGTYDIISEDKISLEPNISLPTGIFPSPPTTPKGSLSTASSRRRTSGQSREKSRVKGEKTKKYPQNDEVETNENCSLDNNGREDSLSYSITQKVQKGRPPAEAEVTYDEHGNVIAMVRLSVEKLPSHRVRTRYNIIGPDTGPLSSNKVSRKITSKESVLNQLSRGSNAIINIKRRQEASFNKSTIELRDESVKNLPPPLADSVNISPGVIIREGNVVRKGPEMAVVRPTPVSKLHPEFLNLQSVGSLATRQSIDVAEVIGNTSPVIRQIRLPEPIPPISPYQNR